MIQPLKTYLATAYRQAVTDAYTVALGSTPKAAALLGITPRYLQLLVKEHGLGAWLAQWRADVFAAKDNSHVRKTGDGETTTESVLPAKLSSQSSRDGVG